MFLDLRSHQVKPKHFDETVEAFDEFSPSRVSHSELVDDQNESGLFDLFEDFVQEIGHSDNSDVISGVSEASHIDEGLSFRVVFFDVGHQGFRFEGSADLGNIVIFTLEHVGCVEAFSLSNQHLAKQKVEESGLPYSGSTHQYGSRILQVVYPLVSTFQHSEKILGKLFHDNKKSINPNYQLDVLYLQITFFSKDDADIQKYLG